MSYRFWQFGAEQTQKLKQKVDQMQIKLEDQNNSNRLLVLLLSSADNLASKMKPNLKLTDRTRMLRSSSNSRMRVIG